MFCPSVPVAYSVNMKDTYEKFDILLRAVNYNDYKLQIYGDQKVIGMQPGHSWDRVNHYRVKKLPLKLNLVPGEKKK